MKKIITLVAICLLLNSCGKEKDNSNNKQVTSIPISKKENPFFFQTDFTQKIHPTYSDIGMHRSSLQIELGNMKKITIYRKVYENGVYLQKQSGKIVKYLPMTNIGSITLNAGIYSPDDILPEPLHKIKLLSPSFGVQFPWIDISKMDSDKFYISKGAHGKHTKIEKGKRVEVFYVFYGDKKMGNSSEKLRHYIEMFIDIEITDITSEELKKRYPNGELYPQIISYSLKENDQRDYNTLRVSNTLKATIIRVSTDGSYFLESKKVSLKEVESEVRRLLKSNSELKCLLRGDKGVRHGQLAAIIKICKKAGVKDAKIGCVIKENE